MSSLIEMPRQFTEIQCTGRITKEATRRAFEAGMRGEPSLIIQTNPRLGRVTLKWETEIFVAGAWEVGDFPGEARDAIWRLILEDKVYKAFVSGGSGLVKGMEPETAARMLAILRETRVRYPRTWRSGAA